MPESLAILLTLLGRGGAETQAVRLATALAGRGWDCTVFSILPPTDFQQELTAAGVSVVDLGMRNAWDTPRVLRDLLRDLKARRPGVLLTMTYQANILGKVAGKVMNVPVVVSSIRSEHFGGRRRDMLERATGPLATMTTTNSVRVAAALVARRVVAPDRVRVVPNAVSVPAAVAGGRQAVRRELGCGPECRLWLNVGRLVPAKDQAGLLRAFARVVRGDPSARLVIAGDGPLQAGLEESVSRQGLSATVTFLGLRRDVPRLLSAADHFVLSSAWEGSPNALLEAMAAGLSFVTTDVGGAGELARVSGSGLAVPPSDPDALGEAMLDLAGRSREATAALGRAARAYVLREHDAQRIVDAWIALFGELSQPRAAKEGS